MIGTFWNLCRACPSMPVDKLHSEYRSTYRWHEYTGPRQEVVRKPPQPLTGNKDEEENKKLENIIAPPPTSGGGIEPALPRRKKNPSLAYRTHDLLTRRDNDSTSLDRARCADRDRERSGRRSKSEGPPQPPSPPAQPRVLRSDSDPSQFPQDLMCALPVEGGGLKQAISRISTEYRLQFAWPRGKRSTEEESSGPPRKSLSMGAIKPAAGAGQNQQQSQPNQPAPVHKKRITQADKVAGTAELEPLVSNQEEYAGEEKIIQESFSKGEKLHLSDNVEFKTEYKKKFRPFSQYDYIEGRFKPKKDPEPQIVHELENEQGDSWFSEVIELRKKAGEYKNEKLDEVKKDIPPRSRIDHFIRHHLERTTGVGEEGILHSPTREKLEPVIIRKKEQSGDTTRSPQKVQQTHTGRSQSAGPNTGSVENRSPKRTPRASKQVVGEKKQRPKEKATDEVESSEAEILEPVVKSPPEPTRVKSPEQVLMRSPEPVNWTVPLDTGKTFTVTQNVSEAAEDAKLYRGEALCRPHSESKMRSETMEAPPPPPQSAPPALADDPEWKKEEEVKKSYDKPVPGTTLRCLEDPSFAFDNSSHEQNPSSNVLEKAHSRFDQFWGKTNQDNLDNQGQV